LIWVGSGLRDDDHITERDTNTNLDASLTGHARAPLGHLPRYGDCVDHSGELGQKTIAMSLKMRPWYFLISGSKLFDGHATRRRSPPRRTPKGQSNQQRRLPGRNVIETLGKICQAAIPVLKALQGESVIGSYAGDPSKEIRGY
jgi:hypothetical protein